MAHRSFGAQLDAERVEVSGLRGRIERTRELGVVRALDARDLPAILDLDRATAAHYPGGAATRHTPLTEATAALGSARRAFGFETLTGRLVAVTYVDVEGSTAETDFTVVDPGSRGRGLGVAVKAGSVLALLEDGVQTFRTGGSVENAAILAANAALGYRIDEEWLTLEPPAR